MCNSELDKMIELCDFGYCVISYTVIILGFLLITLRFTQNIAKSRNPPAIGDPGQDWQVDQRGQLDAAKSAKRHYKAMSVEQLSHILHEDTHTCKCLKHGHFKLTFLADNLTCMSNQMMCVPQKAPIFINHK